MAFKQQQQKKNSTRAEVEARNKSGQRLVLAASRFALFIFQATPEEPPGASPAAVSASAPASLSESHAAYTHPRAGPTERAVGRAVEEGQGSERGGRRPREKKRAEEEGEGETPPTAASFSSRGRGGGRGRGRVSSVSPLCAHPRRCVAAARLQRSGADIFQLPRFHYGQLRFGAPAGMGPGFSLVRLGVRVESAAFAPDFHFGCRSSERAAGMGYPNAVTRLVRNGSGGVILVFLQILKMQ